ncbi:MAG: hypothetical protein R3B48_27955 [Kofleriaceae bacterium]
MEKAARLASPCRPLARAAAGRRCALLLTAGAIAASGCGRDAGVPDRELGDLVVAPKTSDAPVSVSQALSDPSELARAVNLPHHRRSALLGAHRLHITSSIELAEPGGAPLESLSEETKLEFASDAAWHATSNNSADYGRELTFLDGALYLRARYQRWHRRPPNGDAEPAEHLDRFGEAPAAMWELLAPAIAVADGGALTFADRPAHKIAISTSAKPAAAAREPLAHRKWRQARTVEHVEGEAVLDDANGALLRLALRGVVAMQREGHTYSMKVSVESAVSGLGVAPAITAPDPAEVVLTPVRLHEVDERDQLLEKIAPPLRSKERPAPAVEGAKP